MKLLDVQDRIVVLRDRLQHNLQQVSRKELEDLPIEQVFLTVQEFKTVNSEKGQDFCSLADFSGLNSDVAFEWFQVAVENFKRREFLVAPIIPLLLRRLTKEQLKQTEKKRTLYLTEVLNSHRVSSPKHASYEQFFTIVFPWKHHLDFKPNLELLFASLEFKVRESLVCHLLHQRIHLEWIRKKIVELNMTTPPVLLELGRLEYVRLKNETANIK